MNFKHSYITNDMQYGLCIGSLKIYYNWKFLQREQSDAYF